MSASLGWGFLAILEVTLSVCPWGPALGLPMLPGRLREKEGPRPRHSARGSGRSLCSDPDVRAAALWQAPWVSPSQPHTPCF